MVNGVKPSQEDKNTQSTQPKIARSSQSQQSILASTAPDNKNKILRAHNVFASCEPISGKRFSNLPGRFPVTSTQGMNHMLLFYDCNRNAILCEPMKNRTGPTIVGAYKVIITLLNTRGLKPSLQRLHNEASVMLREFTTSDSIYFQLSPPNIHCCNATERAIRAF